MAEPGGGNPRKMKAGNEGPEKERAKGHEKEGCSGPNLPKRQNRPSRLLTYGPRN